MSIKKRVNQELLENVFKVHDIFTRDVPIRFFVLPIRVILTDMSVIG